jgi:hypothetical protein
MRGAAARSGDTVGPIGPSRGGRPGARGYIGVVGSLIQNFMFNLIGAKFGPEDQNWAGRVPGLLGRKVMARGEDSGIVGLYKINAK